MRLWRCVIVVTSLAVPMAGLATAQERSGVALEGAGGWVGFPDDGVVSEALVGGGARWYVGPRLSIGPEVVYIGGENHRHLIVTGNVTWDLFLGRPVTPFVVIGGGLFQTRESLITGSFTSNEGAFTAGGGLRAAVAEGVQIGVELRAGWETHLRVNGLVSIRLWN